MNVFHSVAIKLTDGSRYYRVWTIDEETAIASFSTADDADSLVSDLNAVVARHMKKRGATLDAV